LTVDTGGRYTEATNDLGLAYARAQRDLGCTYTLGFYVDAEVEDRPRRISVHVKRPGMRAIHPSRYIFRSDSEKRQSMLRAAWISPEMFQTGIVRAHAFPLRPTSGGDWEALLAVSFAVPLGNNGGREVLRYFGASLMGSAGVLHHFSRAVRLEPDSAEVVSEPIVTFLERVKLKPGAYSLAVVVSDPLDERPHATQVPIELPEIPKRELFLVGPILGQQSGPNLIVMGGGKSDEDTLGAENSFEPLLVQQVDGPVDLVALTQACMIGKKKSKLESKTSVTRSVRDGEGDLLGELDPVTLQLEGEDRIRCQNLVDILPGKTFSNGEYVFEVGLEAGRGQEDLERTIRFAVGVDP
jgi:hypothetical protein